MRPAGPPKPQNRGGIWYLVRKRPKAFEALEPRPLIRLSTEIRVADDPRAIRATPAVAQLDRELHIYWRGLMDGQSGEARRRFEAAQKRARALNLDYRTAGELATGPLEEILRRVEILLDRGAIDDEAEVAAIVGGEDRPAIAVAELYDEFDALYANALLQHSPKQRKKWGAGKRRALDALLAVVPNKPLRDLNRNDALSFRDALGARVSAGHIDIGTANKSIGHVNTMVKEVDRVKRLGVGQVFADLRFKGEKKRQRPAFTAEYVQVHLLAPGALDGLNAEARAILWIVADTGARPVEVANIGGNFHLEAPIPFMRVVGEDRVLKTEQSERDIPLVGAALAAARLFPHGFARYHDNADSFSAAANKYLDEHKLLPAGETVYSLRHCFEDRLTAVEAPEKLIAALMGHKYSRPKYGEGPSLEQKRRWMRKIAFTPPKHFGPLA